MPRMPREAHRHRFAFCTTRRRQRMSARKRRAAVASDTAQENGLAAADKIARLLALIVTKDMDTDDAALKLHGAGFGAREISALLGVGPHYVNVVRHRRKGSRAKKARKKG